jgi:hypothetical protein
MHPSIAEGEGAARLCGSSGRLPARHQASSGASSALPTNRPPCSPLHRFSIPVLRSSSQVQISFETSPRSWLLLCRQSLQCVRSVRVPHNGRSRCAGTPAVLVQSETALRSRPFRVQASDLALSWIRIRLALTNNYLVLFPKTNRQKDIVSVITRTTLRKSAATGQHRKISFPVATWTSCLLIPPRTAAAAIRARRRPSSKSPGARIRSSSYDCETSHSRQSDGRLGSPSKMTAAFSARSATT